MFQTVLICTDLTDGLYRLVNFVPSLAASGMTKLVFLHTAPYLEGREIPRPDEGKVNAARDRLSAALSHIPAGVTVEVEVPCGKPSEHILQAGKAHGVDLLVLGMPNRGRLNEQLFGSTTMNICQRLAVPLLTLRPQLVSTYTTEELDLRCRHLFRYLLIPYNGSGSSKYLVERVKAAAQSQRVPALQHCLVAWIIDESGRIPKEHQVAEAKTRIQAVQQDLESAGLSVVTQVLQGEPIVELLNLAVDYDITAIATASDRLGKLTAIPSFTSEIMHRSWHPVLYFPSSK